MHNPSRSAALAVGAAVAGLVFFADGTAAQAHRNPARPDSMRIIQSVEPRSGPPGTEVRLYTENLPLLAQVIIGVGTETGFEEIGRARQMEFGEIGATVTVPADASWDRPIVFIIFHGNFAPAGMSPPFHVTNGDGLVRRTGTVTAPADGSGCFVLTDGDGYAYALSSSGHAVSAGETVTVEGRFLPGADVEPAGGVCGGETLEVVALERLPI